MGFLARRRANKREKKLVKDTVEDMQLMACNRISVLMEMTDNKDYKLMLDSLREDMKFLSPSVLSSAEKVEHKILSKLDDIKIIVSNPKKDARVIDEINELRVLIAERKTIVI